MGVRFAGEIEEVGDDFRTGRGLAFDDGEKLFDLWILELDPAPTPANLFVM